MTSLLRIFRAKNSQRGFTMIELLVAATILAVLAAVAIVSFSSINIRARDGKRKADLDQVRSALELYRTDLGSYPEGDYDVMVDALVDEEYLSSPAPADPDPDEEYTYTPAFGSNPRTYELCANLESDEDEYCVTQP